MSTYTHIVYSIDYATPIVYPFDDGIKALALLKNTNTGDMMDSNQATIKSPAINIRVELIDIDEYKARKALGKLDEIAT